MNEAVEVVKIIKVIKVINCLDNLQLIIAILTLLIAIITLVSIYEVMVNQIYANLVADYRSPEMGAAILAIFNFYKKDCKRNFSKIEEKYIKRYKKEVKPLLKKVKKHQKPQKANFSNTLHFQRRMVEQFYKDMAALYFKHCCFTRLSKNKMKDWLTKNEVKLLNLIFRMQAPARKVFIKADNLPDLPENNEPNENLIHKLYDLVRKF
jgi:hypothetical protein